MNPHPADILDFGRFVQIFEELQRLKVCGMVQENLGPRDLQAANS